MKTKIFTLLAFVAVIQSCKKKEEVTPTPVTPTPSNSSGCYVSKATIDTGGVTPLNFTVYTYNSDHKLTSYQQLDLMHDGNLYNNTTFAYSGNTMTIAKYDVYNVLLTTQIAQLNTSGYIASSITTGIDSVNNNGTNLARNIYDTASFEYDASGFLIKEIHRIKNVEIISSNIQFEYDTMTYVIQNENIVSYNDKKEFVSTYNGFPSVSNQTTYSTWTYGANLNKSGQSVHKGWVTDVEPFTYLGKKSKYLVSTSQYYTNSAENHTYTLNADGYIASSVNGFLGIPCTYTYNCN